MYCVIYSVIINKRYILNCVKKTNLMHNLFLVYFVNLSVALVGLEQSNQGNRQSSNRIISSGCCIHTAYFLMMALDAPETCRG